MIIDFDRIKEERHDNFKGGEKYALLKMYSDDINTIIMGRLETGASVGLHTHTDSSEIIYIIRGNGKVLYDGREEAVKSGSCHYCPKGHAHSLINNGNVEMVFYAVVPKQ